MTINYVPILKWKRGEQNALFNLEDSVKKGTIPFLEVPLHSKNLDKFSVDVKKVWENRPFYFYLSQGWYEDIDEDDPEDFEKEVMRIFSKHYSYLDPKYAIPVFDLSNYYAIKAWPDGHSQRMAIRISGNEFGLIDLNLNLMLADTDRRKMTDLILDLHTVESDDVFAKQSLMKAALSDLDSPEEYRSIIIASNSFPSSFNGLEIETIHEYPRNEFVIHDTAKKLANKLGFTYSYSDYGPTDLSDTTFVIGMSPNFKIKYTGFDKYYYIKGIPIKKGGLDFSQVQKACRILYQNPSVFSGESFSWADKKIAEIAKSSKEIQTGNLTTWVSYSFNHHISFIAKQI